MDVRLEHIRRSVESRDYTWSVHAITRAEERNVRPVDVEGALTAETCEIVEDYPDDRRGASLLLLGWIGGTQPVHVHIAYDPYVKIVTVYEPDENEWKDFRKRR